MKLFGVLGIILFLNFQCLAQMVPGHVEILDLGENSEFSVIKVTGMILSPMADELSELLDKISSGQRLILDFKSEGGESREGYKIIEAIKKHKARLKIDTFVDNGALCASMCIPLFMQGQTRIAGARSSFMFHGASPINTNVPNPISSRVYTDALVEAGASAEWVESLWSQGIFSKPMEYWANGEELFAEKSNIVTKVKSKIISHAPWYAPFDPQLKPR